MSESEPLLLSLQNLYFHMICTKSFCKKNKSPLGCELLLAVFYCAEREKKTMLRMYFRNEIP